MTAAFGIGVLALLFFMYLVLRSQPIPCDRRFPVVVVLSLGAAMAFAFIGGWVTVHGNLPLSADRKNVIRVSAGGGIAVLVVLIVVGNYFFLCGGEALSSEALSSEIRITSPRDGATVFHVSPVEWTSGLAVNHYILVRWEGDSVQHVQEPPSVHISGTPRWSGMATFGGASDTAGTTFYVSILATREQLQPGPLPEFPTEYRVSAPIVVKLAS